MVAVEVAIEVVEVAGVHAFKMADALAIVVALVASVKVAIVNVFEMVVVDLW